MPVLDKGALDAAMDTMRQVRDAQYNIRVEPVKGDGDGDEGGASAKSAEADEKDRKFLWNVFQAFDQNKSGTISVLEVRAVFDRVALEDTFAAKGQGSHSSEHKMLKVATNFIMKLFDDDLDGKLGRSELDRFFQVFNEEDNKIISWDEFHFHGAKLMQSYRERETQMDEAKQRVPTREELKAEAETAVKRHEREARRKEKAPPALPSYAIAKGPGGGGKAAAGGRSRAERPGFA